MSFGEKKGILAKSLSVMLITQLLVPAQLAVHITEVQGEELASTKPSLPSNPFAKIDINKIMQNYAGACSAQSGQLAAMNSAMSTVANSLRASSAGDGVQGAAEGVQAGLNGGCPAPTPVKEPSCSMFAKPGVRSSESSTSSSGDVDIERLTRIRDDAAGGYDPEAVGRLKAKNNKALEAYACQETRMTAIQNEVACIQNAAQAFAQQTTSLLKTYTENLSKMQTDVGQLKSEVSDREQQEVEVTKRLGGDKDSGRKGLIEVREGVNKLLARMNGDIDGAQGVKVALKNLENQKIMLAKLERGLADKVQTETLTEAKKCFSELADPNFREEKNGPPVTLQKYMLSQYERSFQAKNGKVARQGGTLNSLMGNRSSGQNDLRTSTINKATSRKQSLGALVDSFFLAKPRDIESGKQESGGMIVLGSDGFPHVSEAFKTRAREYNDTGLGIDTFVTQGLNYCLKIGRREVARRRTRLAKVTPGSTPQQPQLAEPDSLEGVQQSVESTKLMMKDTRTQIQTRAADLINEYANGGGNGPGFNDAMKALTGLNLPINVAACKQAEPEVQVGCLQDFRNNMNEILSGTGKQGDINMVVPGTNPKNTIQFNCKGLDGCIASMQNVKNNLPKEREKITSFGKQYIQKANANVSQFTAQAKEKMSAVNEQLKKQMTQLNTALASLGITAKIDPKTLKPEELQQDPGSCFQSAGADGGRSGGEPPACLFKGPQNIQALLGGLDLEGGIFTSATDGMAKKREDISKGKQDVNEWTEKIQKVFDECVDKAKEEARKTLKDKDKEDRDAKDKESGEIRNLNNDINTNFSSFTNSCTPDFCRDQAAKTSLDSLMGTLRNINKNSGELDTRINLRLQGLDDSWCGGTQVHTGQQTAPQCNTAASNLKAKLEEAEGRARTLRSRGAE